MSSFTWLEGDKELFFTQVERAMQFGRNHALVQSILGAMAFRLGDPVTGAELESRAAALDPISSVHQSHLGFALYFVRRFEEAEIAFRRGAELNPEKAAEYVDMQVWLAIHRQDYQAAAELAGRLPPGPERDQAEAMLAFQSGDEPAANAALERLQLSAEPSAEVCLAYVYAFRGEADRAFRQLPLAVDYLMTLGHINYTRQRLIELQASPFLRPLQGDPRWTAWLEDTRERLLEPYDDRLVAALQRYLAESADG
jgi:tetratricopeptide (TPR) repeat protein